MKKTNRMKVQMKMRKVKRIMKKRNSRKKMNPKTNK